MAAYLIADHLVTDPEKYKEYAQNVPDIVAKYGGDFLVRGGAAEPLEGDWSPNRIVVLRFESLERAKEWYYSDDYQQVIGIRHSASTGRSIFVEGP